MGLLIKLATELMPLTTNEYRLGKQSFSWNVNKFRKSLLGHSEFTHFAQQILSDIRISTLPALSSLANLRLLSLKYARIM